MGDEGSEDKDHGREGNQYAIEAEVLNLVGDGTGDGAEEARRGDGFAETKATGCEDDDGPKEIVEVFLVQNAGPKEKDHGNNGNHAHVAENMFELVANAP